MFKLREAFATHEGSGGKSRSSRNSKLAGNVKTSSRASSKLAGNARTSTAPTSNLRRNSRLSGNV